MRCLLSRTTDGNERPNQWRFGCGSATAISGHKRWITVVSAIDIVTQSLVHSLRPTAGNAWQCLCLCLQSWLRVCRSLPFPLPLTLRALFRQTMPFLCSCLALATISVHSMIQCIHSHIIWALEPYFLLCSSSTEVYSFGKCRAALKIGRVQLFLWWCSPMVMPWHTAANTNIPTNIATN